MAGMKGKEPKEPEAKRFGKQSNIMKKERLELIETYTSRTLQHPHSHRGRIPIRIIMCVVLRDSRELCLNRSKKRGGEKGRKREADNGLNARKLGTLKN